MVRTLLGEPPPAAERQDAATGLHGSSVPLPYAPAVAKAEVRSGRVNGRRAEETRPCSLRVGAVPNAAGSAYLEQGGTKIIASVYGPRQASDREARSHGLLSVELQFASFSSRGMRRDDAEKRAALYNSLLKGTLESIVLVERYAKTVFDVSLLVLEDDGAVLTGGLTAASLALADAEVEMRDLVAGSTVHLANSHGEGQSKIMLDCDRAEEMALADGSAVLHLGLCPVRDKLCLLHSAGPLPPQPFEQMVLLAKETAVAVGAEMRRCLERRVERRIAKRARLSGDASIGFDGYSGEPIADDGYGSMLMDDGYG
eukprot:TRINITY_DN76466_c0_g1_i1.p1 TRINITY_DN76466_c0_g1~~TRINITY_DN76466_c0_g1_i1.p1  ORF type:complete len:314 (+),score=66.32 TRINITY_DN76466_c0_g1_i1:53-994(+)